MKRKAIVAALAAALTGFTAYTAVAAEQGAPAQTQRERIYGYQMMTDAERNEYRQKMRGTKTVQEQQALRDEHRKTMEARMKERGGGPGAGGPGFGKGPGGGPGAGGQGYGKGPGGPGYGKGGGPGGPGKGFGPGGPGKGRGPGNQGAAPQG